MNCLYVSTTRKETCTRLYKSSLRKSGNENKKVVEINIVLDNILDVCFHTILSNFSSGTNKGMQTKHLSSNALKLSVVGPNTK